MAEEKDLSKSTFVNPIDKEKVAENPGLLPYAHTISAPEIKPLDKGRIKGNAMAAMVEQTNMHLGQIKEQIELLARQAKAIQHRVDVSTKIYKADTNFDPVIGHIYYLYARTEEKWVLSMISPSEWGARIPYQSYLAKVSLLSDHTWDVLETEYDL